MFTLIQLSIDNINTASPNTNTKYINIVSGNNHSILCAVIFVKSDRRKI